MSDDGRRNAVTKAAIRSAPAATLPGVSAAPPPPIPAPPARPMASTMPGHAATTPAAPGRSPVAMPAAPPATMGDGAVELHPFDARTQPNGTRRRVLALTAGAAVALVALFVILRPSRHVAPASVATAKTAASAPVLPEVAVAPREAPAPPEEIAAAPSPAPRAEKTPRVRHRPVAPHVRVAAQERRRPVHKRVLDKTEKPAGDREAARAAYKRGSDLLLTGDASGAVDAYQDAVRLAPSDPVGYRGLGLAYEKEGKNKDAIASLVSYLKLSRHAHDREVIARRLHRLTHPE